MTRSTFVDGRDNHSADVRFNNARADREYEKAFREAGLGQPQDDPDGAAGLVRESAVRVPLVAALDGRLRVEMSWITEMEGAGRSRPT